MRHLVTIIAVAAAVAASGCGKSHGPATEDGGGDAREPTDGGTVDAGTSDTGPVVDPCAAAGCGAPPDCDVGCTAMCGCCSCSPGMGLCTADGSAMRLCTESGCYDVIECEPGTSCEMTDDGPTCVSSEPTTCEAIEDEYRELTATKSCGTATECHVVFGHCSVGLGGCGGAVNDSVSQDELDALAEEWMSKDCDEGRGVCDCAGPLPDDEARCVGGECTIR